MKPFLAILLTLTISFYGVVPLAWAGPAQTAEASLSELIDQGYLELFRVAPELNIPKERIEEFRERLENQKDQEEDELDNKEERIDDRIDAAQKELKRLNRDTAQTPELEAQRHELHCTIQKLREELDQTKLALQSGLDNTYDNKFAKLKILEEWPAENTRIKQQIEEGKILDRKFSDFRDVGFRNDVFDDQAKDVETGREVVEQMRRQNLLPPEVENEEVISYVRNLAERIARHSDLKVPLQVTVLRSKEINAFALPGGFLFVNSGLIEATENEAQLAGVLAHEIAHSAARHGDRLMGKAQIANIVFQAAQLAALIFTGGVASIGTYYALQYGFYGLGLVLNLALLGVSRDFEIEADILGTQYLWHAGYDTTGFVNFFEKMAREKGYISGLSWFRTHPPFYERMARTYEEIVILPEQEEPVQSTTQFQNAKAELERSMKEWEEQDREAPTLRRVYHCDDVTVDPTTE